MHVPLYLTSLITRKIASCVSSVFRLTKLLLSLTLRRPSFVETLRYQACCTIVSLANVILSTSVFFLRTRNAFRKDGDLAITSSCTITLVTSLRIKDYSIIHLFHEQYFQQSSATYGRCKQCDVFSKLSGAPLHAHVVNSKMFFFCLQTLHDCY